MPQHSSMADPFGRALRDFHRDEQTEPLIQFDGEHRREHPIEQFYFEPFTGDTEREAWIEAHLRGPMLDVGAGAGRDALYFQGGFEVVALERSQHLVDLMDDRGVADARDGDMFALPEQFEDGRFASALVRGTQLGLAKSMAGLRGFLDDLATVTTPDATALVDCYDPTDEAVEGMLGYRSDPTPGLAFRVMAFEYEGEAGGTLLFRLFSPARLREAASDTGWTVTVVEKSRDSPYYMAALETD
jgi:SAM-dependent methyltransferase